MKTLIFTLFSVWHSSVNNSCHDELSVMYNAMVESCHCTDIWVFIPRSVFSLWENRVSSKTINILLIEFKLIYNKTWLVLFNLTTKWVHGQFCMKPSIFFISICMRYSQSLYDERTRLISQLYRRLKRSTGESQVEKQSADTEDGLSQIISIRKGLMLILRLIPLLDKVIENGVLF